MSGGRNGIRGAAVGLALTAAGMLYSRLGARAGQKPAQATGVGEPSVDGASTEEVERARSELAAELARLASGSGR